MWQQRPRVSSLQAPKHLMLLVLGLVGGDPGVLELELELLAHAAQLVAAQAVAEQEVQGRRVVQGAVQGVLGSGTPFWMWLAKILWATSRVTRSYFTGILPGTTTPTMGSLLQRPVQPVWWMTMSSRPEDWMCLRNSSMASREPAACSQVAEPIWIWILLALPLSARAASALAVRALKNSLTGFSMGISVNSGRRCRRGAVNRENFIDIK